MSDDMEDELLSLAIIKVQSQCNSECNVLLYFIKNGKKVAVGTQEGTIDIFSWGDWGDMSDRFPGHPNSIDSMVVIDQDTIFTASSDGLIRYT